MKANPHGLWYLGHCSLSEMNTEQAVVKACACQAARSWENQLGAIGTAAAGFKVLPYSMQAKQRGKVINPRLQPILYAVMNAGGFLGFGVKLLPVPWQLLAPLPSAGIFFLDVSEAKLEKAS